MKQILVTGSLAFDYIMDFPGVFSDHIMPDKIHQINLSFSVNTLKKHRGGTAGNIAYSLSLFQQPVAILSVAGKDFKEYARILENSHITTSYIKIIKEESTASAFIMTDKNDNQISGFYPGALKNASTLSIKRVDTKPHFVIISPDNPEAMTSFSKECQDLSLPYLFDPGMQLPRLTDKQLEIGARGATIVIGNDYEMSLLKSRLKIDVKIIITTLGPKGSLIQTNDQTLTIPPAKPQEVLDPTGAGDAYRAGFMAGYIRNFNLKICGQMGSVAAAYAIEKYGTQEHTFTLEEFKKRYSETFNEVLELEK
ncbi:MAG: carbohydrate kinase family protein [Candidatus Levybacteria bacterium]|nr:carbohydrate kinase family protein [Candidatus Levybacteria bacterium]